MQYAYTHVRSVCVYLYIRTEQQPSWSDDHARIYYTLLSFPRPQKQYVSNRNPENAIKILTLTKILQIGEFPDMWMQACTFFWRWDKKYELRDSKQLACKQNCCELSKQLARTLSHKTNTLFSRPPTLTRACSPIKTALPPTYSYVAPWKNDTPRPKRTKTLRIFPKPCNPLTRASVPSKTWQTRTKNNNHARPFQICDMFSRTCIG